MATRAIGAIEVTDLGGAMAFFVDQLQFALVEHQPAADVAMIDINGALALLAGAGAGDVTSLLTASPARFKPGDTLPLFSGDLDARRAALVERGVPQADIVTQSWGDRVLSVRGSDEYPVAMIEPAQRSPEETVAL